MFIEFYAKRALLKPFTILAYVARIVGIDTLKEFNLRISTEPPKEHVTKIIIISYHISQT